VGGACAAGLAIVVFGVAGQASALADPCSNAELRTGPSERLPDCRAYEQVSPVQKGGLDAVSLQPVLPAQSSACEAGETCTIAYMNVGASFAGAPGNEFANAYLASRGADGWQTTPLTPPTPQAPANSHLNVTYAFSANLSQAVERVPLQQLTESAPPGVYNLFVRQPDGGYSLVTANAPSKPPRPGCGGCFEGEDVPVFVGASADFSRILFEANDSLVEGAPTEFEGGRVENLYESVDERVRLVGILPDGAIPPEGASAGGGIEVIDEHTGELGHAISEDGSRVLFEADADGGAAYEGGPAQPTQAGWTELYDRVEGAHTVELSAPARAAQPEDCETIGEFCDPGAAKFWDASADGSVVYFTSRAALTKRSFTGPEEPLAARRQRDETAREEGDPPVENPGDDLYRYDLATNTLTDITVDADNPDDPDGADVLGVVGASEDGSYVYFVATGELAAGARSGRPNLYAWHETREAEGTVAFIATLRAPEGEQGEEEERDIEKERSGPAFSYESDILDWTSDPRASQAYVTPDGTHLAFMSVEPLTGYENKDRVTGKPDHEVYEYSAESGQLVCASCDPDGAPPLGSAFIGAGLTERASTPFYQPRALNDEGTRLFFTSPDPLVPGISGGAEKVFEYEDGGAQLISGPEGGGSAMFLDASASGDDVFFATREQLVSSDTDELVDVYDARVDGGLPAPSSVPTCQAEACREPVAPAPSFPTPLSASFAGAGNIPPVPSTKPTRKQLLARALAKCAKLKRRRRRAACVVDAKRRYAPKPRATRHIATAKRSRSRG